MASKRYKKELAKFETAIHDLVWSALFEDGLDIDDIHTQTAKVLCQVTMHHGIEVGEMAGHDAIEEMKAKSAAAGK
jgi:hypothetical protein